MNTLYPIKFKPVLKETIWGGKNLQSRFSKDGKPGKKIGESWEINGMNGESSVVTNGFLKGNSLEEIIEVFMGDLIGDEPYERFGNEFPLLIKFIDASETLSIQVHPDDRLAMERHHAWGKTEMWYIIDSERDSLIYTGFKRKTSKEEYQKHLDNKTIPDLVNKTPVKPGDSFFIPAGMVHAIGAGVILTEIQETSDITYRIYYWDRTDKSGRSREMHSELALDAINFDMADTGLIRKEPVLNQSVTLAECSYFHTRLLKIDSPVIKDYSLTDSFIIYICISSAILVECFGNTEKLVAGETVLIPAAADSVTLIPIGAATILEVYIPLKKNV